MAILVGSAYSTYELKLDPLRRNVSEARGLLTDLQRDATALTRVRPVRLIDGTAAATSTRQVRDLAREADRALSDFERLERQLRRTTDAEIAAARATGEYGRAISLLERELSAATAGSERYFQVQARLAATQAAQARATAPAPGLGARAFEAVGGAGGVAAIAGTALLAGGVAASGQAREYKQITQDLQILAGSQARYNELLAIGRQNQALFGGSLTSNLDPLQQLIFISNRYNANLSQLNETTQLLAAINRTEGFAGGSFSLSEFLGGDTTSIVERFNLPRQALNELAKANIDTSTKLERLNQLILEQGNISEVLAARLRSPEVQINRVGAAFERITIAGGNVINTLLGIAAAGANSGALGFRTDDVALGFEVLAGAAERYFLAISQGTPQAVANAQLVQELINPTQQATAATDQATAATQRQTEATAAASSALAEYLQKQQQAATEGQANAAAQAELEALALRVATGQQTQASAVAELARSYPELAAQAGPLIAAQVQLAMATDAYTAALDRQRQADGQARLAQQRANTRDNSGAIGFDAPGRGKRDEEIFATIQATQQQLKAEQTKAASAERVATTSERSSRRQISAAQTTTAALAREQEQQVRQTEETYRRLRQAQEDYTLRSSRDEEDFQRQRRRLLAEGRIFEARQAEEEFRRTQRRSAEDFAIAQARTREQAGLSAGDAVRSVSTGAQVAPAAPASGGGVSGGTSAATPAPRVLQIQIAPLAVQVDGQTIATVTWPLIERQVVDDLTRIQVAAPPQTSGGAVSGPRP